MHIWIQWVWGIEPEILHFLPAPGEAGNTSSRTTLMNVLYNPKMFLFFCPSGFMPQKISKYLNKNKVKTQQVENSTVNHPILNSWETPLPSSSSIQMHVWATPHPKIHPTPCTGALTPNTQLKCLHVLSFYHHPKLQPPPSPLSYCSSLPCFHPVSTWIHPSQSSWKDF